MAVQYFVNKKALVRYEVLERLEAGLVLTGSEAKAVREGRLNLTGSMVTIMDGKPVVVGMSIARYSHSSDRDYDQQRTRILLLHKKEIDYLAGKIQTKGLTAVPLNVYFQKKRVKLEIGIVKGKKLHDRREELKKRDLDREQEVEIRGKV
ncbi:SsrA-binding protein [candidate division WWE3 bacterium RIFCSPLOWO2_01_FULL_42_11]|uniref:SsrA-binding protein n=1 Tax=candidate division WWE3 bacterium RIFCSPLOWO2_01_FULL_42_11 TaxID=1802627 RepID=A0A1F4VLJ6_UNCKA|nr:MAG: SsrA-binding protein [candidate division WWE3 bacterium RIFCSPLOWO2_01_FULL_42_11]